VDGIEFFKLRTRGAFPSRGRGLAFEVIFGPSGWQPMHHRGIAVWSFWHPYNSSRSYFIWRIPAELLVLVTTLFYKESVILFG
jgi:hypothetical protein